MYSKRVISILISAICSALFVQSYAACTVGGTDFDTNKDLCSPKLTVDTLGWYSSKLDLSKTCKGDMVIGPEYAKQLGLTTNAFTVKGSDDFDKNIDAVFKQTSVNINGQAGQYGITGVVGNPKVTTSFAQSINNQMLVNVGSGQNCDFLTYTVNGLEPGSTVTLSFTLYNLLDVTYFEHLTENVIPGSKPKKNLSDYISKYNFAESSKTINGNELQFAVSSNADGITYNTGYGNTIQVPTGMGANVTKKSPAYGTSTPVKHTTKVPSDGSVTFYFFRTNDSYQIPIGIDDIRVEGSIKPTAAFTGNPCPEQPLRIFTKQSYPEGTKYSWSESKTGQKSSDANFVFTPDKEETDYTVSLEVTLPGCTAAKADKVTVHSGTCCTSAEGAPMAMTNLFFDDFGSFVSDNTYEWTDRFGVTHTEKIPVGQVHTAQSHGGDLKIPYVKAYNIESSGAKLKVPLAGAPGKTELYNHGVYVISKYGGYPGGVQYDNSGTQNGGMLQFDLNDDGSQDDFFEIDIDHICTGKEITFGADFASISLHPGSIEVVLEYNGKTLDSDFRYFTSGTDGWKSVNKSFTIKSEDVGGKSEVTVKMKVRHYGKMADGTPITGETRDYGIDNIIFQVCTPPDVDVESSVSTGKDYLDLCTEDALTLTVAKTDEAKKALKQFYAPSSNPGAKLGFVYQYTFQDPAEETEKNPIKWQTIHKTSEVVDTDEFEIKVADYWDDIFAELDKEENKGKMIFFRVVVGEYSDLLSDTSWKTSSAFSPCRKISISTVRLFAGLNCAACEKAKKVAIEAADKSAKIEKSGKKKVVNLCEGETASFTAGPFEPTNPDIKDANDDKLARQYTSTLLKGDNPKTATKVESFGKGDPATFTIKYADAGVYLLRAEDADFPDAESCYVYDTIEVVANPKPTETLDAPDPFCEGTLTTEPSKKIDGYTIAWYTASDTATKADEPVVKTTKAADSPASSYYVLIDKKTGCRSDANEYVVTVNKAEKNPLADGTTVEYKKSEPMVSLKEQNPTIMSATSGYKMMWGEVKNETTSSRPSLETASLGTASTTVPTPTVKDKTDPNPEYVWYYEYQESPEGCLSDTVLVVAEIYGAPVPKVKNGAFCSTESAGKISDYAEINQEDPGTTYTLTFYDESGNKIADDYAPDITTPGEYKFYVTQSSQAGGESAKKEIVIKSYGVADVELTEAKSKYCKDETAKNVETFVKVKSSSNSYIISDISADDYEIFEGAEPSEKAASTGGVATMPVSTASAVTTDYYARATYKITETGANLITNNSTCYGSHVNYQVEVQEALEPLGTGSVTYLKDEGASGGYKKPLTQDPEAVKTNSCDDCELIWYASDKKTVITEADATPTYNASLVGNDEKTYYVSQKNQLGCESPKKPVTIIVSGYPSPEIKNLEVCENSETYLTGNLWAEPKSSTANTKDEFELVWYMAKEDGTIDDSKEYEDIKLSPSEQKAKAGESVTEYTYYVLQRLKNNHDAKGAAVPVKVKVHTLPVLKEAATDPICKGDVIDLKDMYTENTHPTFSVTSKFNDENADPVTNTRVGERGTYYVQAQFTVSSTGEECKSEELPLKVFVHEITAEIEGSDKTCSGEAVDLKSKVTYEGGLTRSDISYEWKTQTTAAKGTNADFNTTADGLANTGDILKVDFTVSGGACTGSKAIKASTHTITVGDGPLVGKIAFTEDKNNESGKEAYVSQKNIIFTSCGSSVTATLDVDATEDAFTYSMDGGAQKSASFSGGKASLTLEPGVYEVNYTNKCPTSFSFTIMDVSTKTKESHSMVDICEGENFKAELAVTEKKSGFGYTVEWFKDGNPIQDQTNTTYSISNAAPGHSGVYTYAIYSGGCTETGKIADGNPLTVRPNIKIDEANLVKNYEFVRGETAEMEIPFIVPSDPSSIKADIVWTDNGTSPMTLTGAKTTIPSFSEDHTFDVVIAPADYCKATTTITVKVDAKLQMEASLDKDEMCVGENHTLTVDTTGTGKVLHADKLVLKVEEVVDGNTKTLQLLRSDGKLAVRVSPEKDAVYNIIYTYQVGNQDESKTLTMRVHEAFQVDWSPKNLTLCEGSQADIQITKLYPDDTQLEWETSSDIMYGDEQGATVKPEFTSIDGFRQTKRLVLTAKNGICADKEYYPTVTVDKPLEGEIKSVEYACENTDVKFDASSYNAQTYKWTSENQELEKYDTESSTIVIKPKPEYATLMVEMTRGACTASDEHTVTITYEPVVESVDSLSYRDVEIVLESGTGTPPFQYIIDGDRKDPDIESAVKTNLEYGKHEVKIIDEAGCVIKHTFIVNSPTLKFPIIISPNGDGTGDRFKVETLSEAYPNANVKIFDRWGKVVAEYKAGDDEGWDGTYNGNALPSTDYWYEVEIKEINKKYSGHFTLMRQ